MHTVSTSDNKNKIGLLYKAEDIGDKIMTTNNYQEEYDDVAVMERPLIDPDFRLKPMYNSDEFWGIVYKEVGQMYGLNDIRDAK